MFPLILLNNDEYSDESLEQLGSKQKYWFKHEGKSYLFKIGRPGTGENWAEKIAAELAELLKLPHAHYDLAIWRRHKGVLSPNIVPDDGLLILGNELLSDIYTKYTRDNNRREPEHTLERIYNLLTDAEIGLPTDYDLTDDGVITAYDVFLGYLLLDTWISNQDRHHENWGIIQDSNGRRYLAPTFDHAASMGQNEKDDVRGDRLKTKDNRRNISAYIEKARSVIYESNTGKKPLLTLELFEKAARKSPKAARIWLDQLQKVSINTCQNLFDQLPPDEITPVAKEFALEMLALNKKRLLDAKKL
uniref:HipA-like C-terminal domain-containing protein n=1 Tax=Candidatus Kentrum sp. FW TaxID=2126338 RepID=A0A450SEC6_9GAMM|nr:MAG: hypothetical protein BECKFW1821B_GA0114236_100819 [Candidatus Kentron sp. FW]